MPRIFADVADTFVPHRNRRHGLLPSMMVLMTVVTGLVDAFSYLVLGHVFVANMTGNIVFLGFALAGAPGFSISASLAALGAFVVGAAIGGRLFVYRSTHRGSLLVTAASIQSVFLAIAFILATQTANPSTGGYRFALIGMMGIAMGLQNATARKLAIPDLTTTVLTLTITGMVADLGHVKQLSITNVRRAVSILGMFIGGLAGAILVLHAQIYWPLLLAVVGILAVVVFTSRASRTSAEWSAP
jgi:uncharacterized membrane protein YoaK (UPF0700 family)